MTPSLSTAANRYFAVGIKALFMIPFLALIGTALLLVNFYLGTEGIPPDDAIRPMGLVIFLDLTGYLSILAEGGVALYAIVAGLIRQRWAQCGYALLAFGTAWIPLYAGDWGFHYVVALRHLSLAP